MSVLLTLRSLATSSKFALVPRVWCAQGKESFAIASIQGMAPQARTMTQQGPQPISNSEDWRIIYRLPMISLASAFNRLKIPYGLLNAVLLPAAFALEQISQLPLGAASQISAVGITSWMTLAICSMVTKDMVGIIYINDTNDRLKLAYVDYWGKRHDVCIDLDDLVPEWEKQKPSKLDFYQALTLYSNEKVKYKLLSRFGSIEDPETFVRLFGE